MKTVRYFRDLEAWQSAMDLAVAVYDVAADFPQAHRYELGSQVRRCATSVPSNVAEGHAQRADRVFLRHVGIALGSLAELETQLELAERVKLIDPASVKRLQSDLERTGQLLHGLRRALRQVTIRNTVSALLLLSGLGGLLYVLVPV
jgi:four helix bundle protein